MCAQKFPLYLHDKLDQAFDRLKDNFLAGKKLHGELEGYYKYSIGDYRIVYHFDVKKSKVTVVKLEHRQGVYK